jgi:beta-galactosidase
MGIRISQEIFGAEIQYFRLDPKYWEAIVKRLKDSGLRCVTTYTQWSTHLIGEPDKRNPAGILDFEGKTDPRRNLMKFLDIVRKHGLNMTFRCGPFCCNEMIHGGYPPWLVLGDPNMMVWDSQNRTTQGYWIGKREGSQPSYLHPVYLDWCRKWLAEVDKIIAPRLKSKGGFITMINLDNEISYIVKDSFLDSDYNPVNVKPGGLYHQFLREKYGSKDLPYGGKSFSIEDVTPPRFIPDEIGDRFAYYSDWMEFKTWCMCSYIRELRKMHEDNGVKDVTFMTNFNPHLPEGVPTRMPEFEKAVGENGIVGYDFYRGVFMSYSGYHSMARVLKMMNASLKYTWSAEFMAGTWMKNLGETRVSDEHMRFMARCALAHGCKAIDWFMFHDRDCWGDAPVSSHGHERSSFKVLKEIPEILFKKIKEWDLLIPQYDVGIIYDLVQHQHTSIGDPMPCADNDLHVGKPCVAGVKAGLASQEYYGLFRLVEEAGAQAAVVDIMYSSKKLEGMPLAFMPGSPLIESAANERLNNYVANGGTLIVTGPWPCLDESGAPLKFLGLARPAEELARHNLKLGKGCLVWLPSYIAQEKPEEERLESIGLVEAVFAEFSIVPHVSVKPSETVKWVDWQPGGGHREYAQERNLGSAVLQSSPNEYVLFVLNHYPEATNFKLKFGRLQPESLENLSNGERVDVKDRVVSLDIDRKSCEIYRLNLT